MTQEQAIAKIEQIIELLRPEAKEAVKLALADKTTQNGYGKMLGFLAALPDAVTKKAFLAACLREGYPKETVISLLNLI